MKKQLDISTYSFESKKTGKDIDCVKVTIGKYSGLLFPNEVEMEYIDNFLSQINEESTQEKEEEIYS